ncbi:MAG: hypothetical protein QXL94_07405 [Candidatus Parvarchaeum sp.]
MSNKISKDEINRVYANNLLVIFIAIALTIIVYMFLPKITYTYTIISVIISLSATYLITEIFKLNKNAEEERLLFNNLISISILLFIGVTSFLTINNFVSCNSANLYSTTCNIVTKLIGMEYASWLIIFLVLLIAALAIRLRHHYNKNRIFSIYKSFSYLSIIFLIIIQIILILNITGILPLITSGS